MWAREIGPGLSVLVYNNPFHTTITLTRSWIESGIHGGGVEQQSSCECNFSRTDHF